jgi:KH domain-containing protein
MRKINVGSVERIKKAAPLIENKIKINISFGNNYVNISGNELNEFIAEKIILAVDFGFDPEDALLLRNEDFVMEFVGIKEFTRRKNVKDVKARVIGTEGKAKRTIETLTGAVLCIKDNCVGIIVDTLHCDAAVQAVKSLIQGARHGNVFAYLEKQGVVARNSDNEDLGLREKKNEK